MAATSAYIQHRILDRLTSQQLVDLVIIVVGLPLLVLAILAGPIT